MAREQEVLAPVNDKECTAPDELFMQTWPEVPEGVEFVIPPDGLPCEQPGKPPGVVGEWCEGCPFAINLWPWDNE